MAAPPAFEEDEEETPLQQLIRHWMNEWHAPDVLLIAEDVLSGFLDHVWRQGGEMPCLSSFSSNVVCDVGPLQFETVQFLRSDPSSSEEEHFRIMLAQRSSRSGLLSDSTGLFKVSKVCHHATSFVQRTSTTTTDRKVCSIYHDRSGGSTMSLGERSRPRSQVAIVLPSPLASQPANPRIHFRFARLTYPHFYVSVLQGLPEDQQTLDDKVPFFRR